MLDPKNPFDPFDDYKRWLRSLWPVERWLVLTAAAGVITLLLMWAFR